MGHPRTGAGGIAASLSTLAEPLAGTVPIGNWGYGTERGAPPHSRVVSQPDGATGSDVSTSGTV